MHLPKNDPDFVPFAVRSDNLLRTMHTDGRRIPREWPALALLQTSVKALAQRDRQECAELLRNIAEALEKTSCDFMVTQSFCLSENFL